MQLDAAVAREKISRRETARRTATKKGSEAKKAQGNRINKQINLCYVLDAARGRVSGGTEKKRARWSGQKRGKPAVGR